MEEAAQNLGASGFRLFRRIVLPLAMPGYIAGASLVFVKVFDDLATPLLLNVKDMLAPQAYLRITSIGIADPMGYVISVVLIVASVAAMAASALATRGIDYSTVQRGGGGLTRRALRPFESAIAYLTVTLILLLVLAPHAGLLLLSFATIWSFSPLPDGFTVAHYARVFGESSLYIKNTLIYASLAGLIDVVFGTAIAYLVLRTKLIGRDALDWAASAALAVPGVVLGIGYLRAFYGVQLWDGTPLASLWIVIVLALAIRRLPYALRACYAALQQISVSLEEAAENLGATKTAHRSARRDAADDGRHSRGIRHELCNGRGRAVGDPDAGAIEFRRAAGLRPLCVDAIVGGARSRRRARRHRRGAGGRLHPAVASGHRAWPHHLASETLTAMTPSTDIAVPTVGIRIEQVNLSYGDNHVLRSIDLEIRPGELFAFLGPSGCGKTTLLRLIAGLQPRRQRPRRWSAAMIFPSLPPWKRDIGMVFQSYALWPHMTVARNVAFGLEEKRVPRSQIGPRVAAALELVGLTGLDQRRPAQLSGGQQQRVALARTIAVEPKLLLLDEPLSNLDAKLRVQVRRELRELQQRLGLTTIFVTHDQEEANTICDRIAVMNDGVVQQVGTPKQLYEQPANLFVANFLGTANILEGRITGDGASRVFEAPGDLRIPMPPDLKVPPLSKMVFRPQDATIMAADEAARPGTARVTGTVSYREFLGSSVRYGVRAGTADIAVDRPFHAGDTLYEVGTTATVAIATSAMRWLSV